MLSGLGGVGKTQIAVEYVYRHHTKYQHVFWVNAATAVTRGAGFGEIARRLGLPEVGHPDERVVFEAVNRWLAANEGWLLVLDNADDPEQVKPAIVGNRHGHYLISSRASTFDFLGVTKPNQVGALTPEEATDFLLIRTGRRETVGKELEAAEEIAKALGRLPLALEQAGGYITSRKSPFSAYLSSYRTRRLELLAMSPPRAGDYTETIATTWSLNLGAVREESVAAAEILEYSAFAFPDDIPFELLVRGSEELGGAIAPSLRDFCPPAESTKAGEVPNYNWSLLFDLLYPLTRYSLIQVFEDMHTYSLHRLVQEVIKTGMEEGQAKSRLSQLLKAMTFVFPMVGFETWGLCSRLLPHALEVAGAFEEKELETIEGGTLIHRIGHFLEDTGRYPFSLAMYDRAIRIRQAVLGGDHADLGTSMNNKGLVLFKLGKFPESKEMLQHAIDIRIKACGEMHRDVAQTWNNLALAVGELGDLEAAHEYLVKSNDILEKTDSEDEEGKLTRLNNIAGLLHRRGKTGEAEAIIRDVIKARERLLGEQHPDVAFALCNLAVFVGNRENVAEGLTVIRRAIEIQKNTIGEVHPDYGRASNIYGSLLEANGQYKEAIAAYMTAGDVIAHTMGSGHPDIGTVYNNLGYCYDKQGDTQEAIRNYEKAIGLLEATVGPDHIDLTAPLSNLAHCYMKARDGVNAKALFERVLKMRRRVLGEHHPEVAVVLGNLAFIEQRTGTPKDTLKLYQDAADSYAVLGDPPIRDCRGTLEHFRDFLRRIARYDDAAKITARIKAIDAKRS